MVKAVVEHTSEIDITLKDKVRHWLHDNGAVTMVTQCHTVIRMERLHCN